MAVPANSTRTSVAHHSSDIAPDALPELYSMIVSSPDAARFIKSGERQMFSRIAARGIGDLVLLWRRPDLVKDSSQRVLLVRLKTRIPEGMRFGDPSAPGAGEVIFAETIDGKKPHAFKAAGLLAVHKWLGALKPGQLVHEFVQQHADVKKEAARMNQIVPAQGGLSIFKNEKFSVRGGVDENGEPWFVAKDVAVALGYTDHTNAIKQHCRGVVKRHPITDALGRKQEVRVICEPDVYRLIFKSQLESAQEFEDWVVSEVLPSIRKTGGYGTQPVAPALPATYLDALKSLVASEEAKQIAEQRALIAEQTKAEIGTRREATAMNTASQAVKKASKLELALDRSQAYATIKRMSMLYHGQKFDWRHLKRTSVEMGIPAVDVFDQNYGTVKAYHADVWREAYALDIPGRLDDEAA